MQELRGKITGFDVGDREDRVFVREGTLLKAKTGLLDFSGFHPRVFILFDDILLWATPGFRYRGHINLATTHVFEKTSRTGYTTLNIIAHSRNLSVQCKTDREHQEWVTTLRETIHNAVHGTMTARTRLHRAASMNELHKGSSSSRTRSLRSGSLLEAYISPTKRSSQRKHTRSSRRRTKSADSRALKDKTKERHRHHHRRTGSGWADSRALSDRELGGMTGDEEGGEEEGMACIKTWSDGDGGAVGDDKAPADMFSTTNAMGAFHLSRPPLLRTHSQPHSPTTKVCVVPRPLSPGPYADFASSSLSFDTPQSLLAVRANSLASVSSLDSISRSVSESNVAYTDMHSTLNRSRFYSISSLDSLHTPSMSPTAANAAAAPSTKSKSPVGGEGAMGDGSDQFSWTPNETISELTFSPSTEPDMPSRPPPPVMITSLSPNSLPRPATSVAFNSTPNSSKQDYTSPHSSSSVSSTPSAADSISSHMARFSLAPPSSCDPAVMLHSPVQRRLKRLANSYSGKFSSPGVRAGRSIKSSTAGSVNSSDSTSTSSSAAAGGSNSVGGVQPTSAPLSAASTAKVRPSTPTGSTSKNDHVEGASVNKPATGSGSSQTSSGAAKDANDSSNGPLASAVPTLSSAVPVELATAAGARAVRGPISPSGKQLLRGFGWVDEKEVIEMERLAFLLQSMDKVSAVFEAHKGNV